VSDLEFLLPIMAGTDWRDPSVVDMPLRSSATVDVTKLKVAMHTDNGIDPVTAPVQRAVRKAADALSEAGVSVVETKPPDIEKTEQIFMEVGFADGGAWVRRLVERAGTRDVSEAIKGWTTELKPVPAEKLTASVEAMDAYRATMLAFMQNYDAVICPVEAFAALPDGKVRERQHATTYTFPFNLTGQPAIVVRADTSPEGLPVGVQIAARHWREDVALALAKRVETALGGWPDPPL
jgi:amidase